MSNYMLKNGNYHNADQEYKHTGEITFLLLDTNLKVCRDNIKMDRIIKM